MKATSQRRTQNKQQQLLTACWRRSFGTTEAEQGGLAEGFDRDSMAVVLSEVNARRGHAVLEPGRLVPAFVSGHVASFCARSRDVVVPPAVRGGAGPVAEMCLGADLHELELAQGAENPWARTVTTLQAVLRTLGLTYPPEGRRASRCVAGSGLFVVTPRKARAGRGTSSAAGA